MPLLIGNTQVQIQMVTSCFKIALCVSLWKKWLFMFENIARRDRPVYTANLQLVWLLKRAQDMRCISVTATD